MEFGERRISRILRAAPVIPSACASIIELDKAILNWLIDKIYISAVEVVDNEKVQNVRIIYNFVGEIAVKHN